jgi:hypothetical protein
MQSIDTIPNGSIPVVSSNGGFADTAVLWVVSRTDPITLSAYRAENLRARLANVTVGPWLKSFAPPATVVNGRVYVAFNGGVSVFGTPLSTSTCFIATAVEGASSFRVATLRAFRDECLLTNGAGRYFVSLYERFSPLLASMIRKSKRLRSIARGFIVLPSFLVAKGLLLIKRRK